METFLLSYSILGGMPFASHASLLRQPNVEYRLRHKQVVPVSYYYKFKWVRSDININWHSM